MEQEPLTLFARIADPAEVVRLLRQRHPKVEIDGEDNQWQTATLHFEKSGSLIFTHDPAYYAEPNWSRQMAGMTGFYSRLPESARKQIALILPTTFKFSLGTLFEPGFDPDGDPRLDTLFAVAELLDGILFSPSALFDHRGKVLIGFDGEEDPEAVWPRVVGEVYIDKTTNEGPPAQPCAAAKPPSPARVAQRVLALMALTARAILEQPGTTIKAGNKLLGGIRRLFAGAEGERKELLAWIEKLGIEGEIEPDEWEVIQRPVGRLDPSQQIDSTWRLEGLAVLAWSLGKLELPPHDRLVDFLALAKRVGLFEIQASKTLLADPQLRPRAALESLKKQLFAIHWRLRNFRIRPDVMNFAEFAKTCWFGPLDISGLPLVEGDLSLDGHRLDRASADAFGTASSAALERHQAVNWLCEGPERYADASVAT